MTKRKRDDDDTAGDGNTEAPNFRKQRQIVGAFSLSAQRLEKAFKLGKGFERQKLGRRKKTAAKEKSGEEKERELKRIDAEIAAVKTLDVAASARSYLAKSLLKIKAIATSPQLPLEISKPAVVSTDAAALNVHARLCNSNPVKEAFPTAIAEVKREFGILDDGASAKRRVRAKDHAAAAGSGSRGHSQDESDEGGEEDALRLRAVQKGNSAKRVDRDILMADVDGSGESGSDDEDEFDRYADRLAGSDDNDDDDEDMHDASSDVDIEDLEQQLEREGIQRKALRPRPHDHAAARSLSDSPSPSPPPDRDGPTRPAPATRKPTTSAFLPILSMAGYISGGSGSDADDFEDVRPKKNRRGQRARQAIWEKKFGAGAKHLETQTAKQGWDPKRGAVAVAGGDARPLNRAAKRSAGSRFAKDANKLPLGRSRASVARQPEAKASIATGGPRERKGPVAAAKAAKPTRDDSGPLHPSWEAARRAKEKKSVPVTFQGKKISFD